MSRTVPPPNNPLVDAGPWLKPADVAPRIGYSYQGVLFLCQDGLIEHQRRESPGGRVTYRISEQAVNRFLNRAVTKVEPKRRRRAA